MKIVFYSGTGNTEKIAALIKEGIISAGKEAELINVENVSINDVKDEEIIILGCPAFGDENLEESYMEPFMDEIEGILRNKKIALFGSYGWGDGTWMRNWEERVRDAGADLLKEGLIINESPDGEEDKCINFGIEIAGD